MNELNLEGIEIEKVDGEKSGEFAFYPDHWLFFVSEHPISGIIVEVDEDVDGYGARVNLKPVEWIDQDQGVWKFYAGIDPDDPNAQILINLNKPYGARLLEWADG